MYANFSPAEHASFLAAKTVAHATGYLDGRHSAADLDRNARSMMLELIAAPDEMKAKPILDSARLLVVSMMGAASCHHAVDGINATVDIAREDRWQQVMGALVELVRHENHALRKTGDQR